MRFPIWMMESGFRYFGGRPKIAKPPAAASITPIPEPSPAPMPVEVEEMSEAKKSVKKRAKKAAGRGATILAGRMMAERDTILKNTLG